MYRAPPAGAPLLVACIYTRVVGIDRRTGARAWVFDAGSPMNRIEIIGDRIYAAGSELVVCLQYPSGAVVWRAPTPVRTGTLLVDADEIFVASAGEIAAFSCVDGRLLWHDPMKGWGHFGIALGVPGKVTQIDNSG